MRPSKISVEIGYVKSKNAIIGMAHRNGWISHNPRKPPTIPAKRHAEAVQRLNRAPVLPLPPEPEHYAGFLGLSLFDLPANGCRFIGGDPVNARYCGQPADGVWCKHHKILCYHKKSLTLTGQ
jgi:hypothetical protein